MSPLRIAFYLNANGVPDLAGKVRGASALKGTRSRGTGILNDEL